MNTKAGENSLPQLRRSGEVTQLYVDGKPFLALGGELGNSTASDLAVLKTALEKCRRMNLNTVMLPVYWDLIEPAEGNFDFTLVRGAIDQARSCHLRLVLLWFGTWKNSMSCYVPSWIKRDTTRFGRVKRSSGEVQEIISPESSAACDADARAFAALMRWLRQYDAGKQTVIMVQVENEIGMIPEARDHSEPAESACQSAVPQKLAVMAAGGELGNELSSLWHQAGQKREGSWGEVFGSTPRGEEIFSAWQFATYVEKVAAAGKREYPLPMFCNAALIRPAYQPGQYPSGGPLPHLMELWRTGAPSLDMICPDIYFPNFMEWCERYTRGGNPLFIPEMAPSRRAPANAVYAIAHAGAIGCGPFAVENVEEESAALIANCYGLLAGMSDLILAAQQTGTMIGLSPKIGFDWSVDPQPVAGELSGVRFEARFDQSPGGSTQATTLPTLGAGRWEAPAGVPPGSALILQSSPEEFVILGRGLTLTFSPVDGHGHVGIDRAQEGEFDPEGKWIGGRWLNGDETHQGRHLRFDDNRWTIQRVTLYRY